jgi:hypothetical protein
MDAIREIVDPQDGLRKSAVTGFKEYLSNFINIKVIKITKKYSLFKIEAKTKFERKLFSDSEMKILEFVVKRFRYTSATKLSNMTHRELPFRETEDSAAVDLSLFLKDKGLPEDKRKEVLEIENAIKSMEYNYHCKAGIL